MDITLTHIVRSGWAKGKSTSSLVFDISQFFPSLNHNLLVCILGKVGFDLKVLTFFANYLVKRRTSYTWNNFSSPMFDVNVGMGQGSALSSILSALYLFPFLYILEKHFENLKILVLILSFVDDDLIIAQNKSFDISNSQLFCSYNILSKLLIDFGLVIEYSKTEIFHFSRSQGLFNPPPLDLSPLRGPILRPKDSWKSLGFIFNCKLAFHKHINHYANKAISTVKYMKLLGNSLRGINPLQKCLLYRCCVLPIALYGFQLWFYNKALILYHMKILDKMQRRAAIWILGAFKTSLSEGIEAIAGIIPMRFHLQKIAKRLQMQPFKLPSNHILRNLIDDFPPSSTPYNPYSIGSLIKRQASIIKGHLINSRNISYRISPSFSPLNQEFSPGSRIINIFPDRFSFNLAIKKEKGKNDQIQAQELDNMVLLNSSSSHTALIISDASIKNNIATSISHVHITNQLITKTVHYAVFITSTEAELFAIMCSINQAYSNKAIFKIIVITNSIHTVKKIFNSSSHLLQQHSASIHSELRNFFISNPTNSIKFWECLSRLRWRFHHDVDKDTKLFNPIPMLPCKIS